MSHMKYCTDLILGEAFCIFIFFFPLDSSEFLSSFWVGELSLAERLQGG